MKLAEFHYTLPESQIAQQPVSPRDHSRLLVVSSDGRAFSHHRFYELDELLRPTDILVTNATRVFPARLRGRKKTGGKVELLLLAPLSGSENSAPRWRTLVRGTTKAAELLLAEGVSAVMEERFADGEWGLRFSTTDLRGFLERQGEMPLPPYIKRPVVEATDLERYQTVFAREEGAVAAPTAGFHFTDALLARLAARGIEQVEIVLHVGWGTFRPVRTEVIEEHRMLAERYFISADAADRLNTARAAGRRIVAVGTTVVRTLETVMNAHGRLVAGGGESQLFIYPGYSFKAIEALITNFHLPDSTPLLLANAFYADRCACSKTKTPSSFGLRAAYEAAIQKGYRFYSYGDAMLIQ